MKSRLGSDTVMTSSGGGGGGPGAIQEVFDFATDTIKRTHDQQESSLGYP
jgi:hypothetical protein|eukprot:COSAG06_NODE_475_length_15278_cov_5.364187_12_plen_50_part_00